MSRQNVRMLVLMSATALIAMLFALLIPTSANAAGGLSVTIVNWPVMGLDSNKPATEGPNQFPMGVKVCNTSLVAATNVRATFNWLSANTFINLTAGTLPMYSTASLAMGKCANFYFNITITRNTAAWNTTRNFNISVLADSSNGPDSLDGITPANRQIYVEKLISQNRNGVYSITGPSTVAINNTYNFTVTGFTATGGYGEWEGFLNFPNSNFRVRSMFAHYAKPAGGTNSTEWADACGWDNDYTSGTYRSCIGPVNYPSGNAGGDPISWVYSVTVLGPAGNYTLTTLIYDFSGSSYHYNSDLGTAPNLKIITVTVPTAVTLDQFEANSETFSAVNVVEWSVVALGAAGMLMLGALALVFVRRR